MHCAVCVDMPRMLAGARSRRKARTELLGYVHASDRVDLKQSATVVGDITTQRISIEEGAHLKGSVNIQKEAPKKEVLGGTATSSSEAAQPRKR